LHLELEQLAWTKQAMDFPHIRLNYLPHRDVLKNEAGICEVKFHWRNDREIRTIVLVNERIRKPVTA
jgi:hypothetical protein